VRCSRWPYFLGDFRATCTRARWASTSCVSEPEVGATPSLRRYGSILLAQRLLWGDNVGPIATRMVYPVMEPAISSNSTVGLGGSLTLSSLRRSSFEPTDVGSVNNAGNTSRGVDIVRMLSIVPRRLYAPDEVAILPSAGGGFSAPAAARPDAVQSPSVAFTGSELPYSVRIVVGAYVAAYRRYSIRPQRRSSPKGATTPSGRRDSALEVKRRELCLRRCSASTTGYVPSTGLN